MVNYLEKILRAPVYDVAIETPLDFMPRFSENVGHKVLCKREDLQPVFSFKCRGAYNKMYHLSEAEKAKGVICSSAGNHAQGVALAAEKLKIKATIVMPVSTPDIKVDSVRRFGKEWVNIVSYGGFYDEASKKAHELMLAHNYTYVHPFDDPDTIAGQGTIGLEILRQHPGNIDAIFVPIGGGGLLSGIAVLVKSLRPEIKLIGVEPDDAASMTNSVKKGERKTLENVGIFADGVAVKEPGKLTFDLIKEHADEFITISTDEMCSAMKDIYDDTRVVAEPSGALATAGLRKWARQQNQKNLTLISIISGANVNFDRLRFVVEHSEMAGHREGLIAVTLPERPGAYQDFYALIDDDSFINELSYRYQGNENALLFVGLHLTKGQKQLDDFIAKLHENGYSAEDLSNNCIAKEHLRYMMMGTTNIRNEYLFDFSTSLDKLMHFFETVGKTFNISLFHYSNHGSTGCEHVLCGIQADDYKGLLKRLDGITYKEETNDPAVKRFMQSFS